jgi:hypothetical protein
MNKTQIEYAHHRINVLLAAKVDECRARHTKPAVTITDERRAELVRTGKVKLKPEITSINHYHKAAEVFDFSKFATPTTVDEKSVDREMKGLRAEAQVLKDKIMLGDTVAAQNAIDVFTRKCNAA